ncbi:PepSY-associated TM helix domain-containing protein [Streptomyces yunnanensis]|uniref:PepSY-associated TM helix domain-containing protein n=1 Tax=Streptomyces yunnanensis TaxID=156453 RepID=UPI001161363C|nr:PepSY domain-containing protein [Streptomyces yunnanensis]
MSEDRPDTTPDATPETPADPSPQTGPDPGTDRARPSRNQLYKTLWRWHFYAGLLVTPLLVLLAVTGGIYLFKPAYENWVYKDLRTVHAPQGASAKPVPLAAQVDAVRKAKPEATVQSVTPPSDRTHSTMVTLAADGGGPWAPTVSVYVNPYDGKVLGSVDNARTFMQKVRDLHGNLLSGTVGDRLVELTASWAAILTCTGLYLWWRARPRRGRTGRRGLRRWHATVGAAVSVFLLLLIATGLPWTGLWGQQLQKVITATKQGAPSAEDYKVSSKIPATTADRLTSNPDTSVPWAAEKVQVPTSQTDGEHQGHEGHAGHMAGQGGNSVASGSLPIEQAVAVAHRERVPGTFTVTLPQGPKGVYTISGKSEADPAKQRTLFLDQYSGKVLASYGWPQYGLLSKLVEEGIALHQGERFGLPNLLVALGTCLAVIGMAVSGVVMWWRRRPTGKGLGAPRRAQDARVTRGVALIMLVLGVAMPLAGISMLAVLTLDWLVIRRTAPLRRFFG